MLPIDFNVKFNVQLNRQFQSFSNFFGKAYLFDKSLIKTLNHSINRYKMELEYTEHLNYKSGYNSIRNFKQNFKNTFLASINRISKKKILFPNICCSFSDGIQLCLWRTFGWQLPSERVRLASCCRKDWV